MPAYAVEQDIIDRYGPDQVKLASDRDDDQVNDSDTVLKALEDACGIVNAWIGARYDLPLTPPFPEVLISCTVDIAFYRLHFRHGVLTDEIKDRHKQCMEMLKAIADGDASLGLDDPPTSVGGAASIVGPERLFTRTTLRNL